MIRVAKLNFIQSQHPRMLSYVECRSDPVFYLVERRSQNRRLIWMIWRAR